MSNHRVLANLLRVLVIIGVGALLWMFVRGIDVETLARELARARWWPLAIVGALQFVTLWCKAASWRIMLAPRHLVRTARLFRYTVAAFAASALAPARAGEALRVWHLRQRDGVPVADSAAIIVTEKLLEGVAMVVLVAPIPWLVPDLPAWVADTVLVGAVALAVALGAGAFAVGRAGDGPRWWAQVLRGMHVLRSPRRAGGALATLIAAWLVDLAMVLLVMYALGIERSPAAALVVLLTVNVAILVPATPGQIGVHEAGALVGLHLLHVPAEQAVGFALLYHAAQVIPLIAIGSVLVTRGLTRIGPETAGFQTV